MWIKLPSVPYTLNFKKEKVESANSGDPDEKADNEPTHLGLHCLTSSDIALMKGFMIVKTQISILNHIALRKAKIVCNFGLPECNRVRHMV